MQSGEYTRLLRSTVYAAVRICCRVACDTMQYRTLLKGFGGYISSIFRKEMTLKMEAVISSAMLVTTLAVS